MESDLIFAAVSNPVRRRILDLLKDNDAPSGRFSAEFPSLPQPAISRHLRVLRAAGLVSVRQKAQQRIYSLRPEGLRELDSWVSMYRKFWDGRPDLLKDHLERDALFKEERVLGESHARKE